MLMEIPDERPVGDVDGFLLFEPAAELHGGPMKLSGLGGIIDDRQDLRFDGPGGELARPAAAGAVGKSVDALFIETGNPESQASFAAPAVAQDPLEVHPDEQQVNGIKPPVGLSIRTTTHGQFELFDRAVFGIRKLTGTADPWIVNDSNDRTSLF